MLAKFAIKDFIDDRKFKNLSSKTIEGYILCFSKFEEFLLENEIVNIEDITASTIKNYLMMLKHERNNNVSSVNTKLKNLKALFNYLEQEEIIEPKRNPTKKLNFAKEEVKIEVFTDAQIKKMLDYYRRIKARDKQFYAYRDYCIIVTLLGTGMRLGEICNLKWKDVDFQNYIITVFGKKREHSSIPMTDKLKKELSEYYVYCQQNFTDLPQFVFTNQKGKYLTENAIKNVFKRLKTVMNFKDVRLSVHTFRHTFAHRCLMAGMDVFTLQKMLRHQQLSMTEKYLALWGTALKEQNDKFNPLNKLSI